MRQLAIFAIYTIVLVTLARLPELMPALAPLRLGKIVVPLGLLLVIAWRPEQLFAFPASNPYKRLSLFLLFIAICSVPFSIWRGGAFGQLIIFSKLILTFQIVMHLSENGLENTLRLAIIAAVLVLSTFLILQTGTGRLYVSSTYDPNDIALLLVTFLPIIAAEAIAGNKALRVIFWFIAGMSLVGLALTQSRGGVVALGAVALSAVILTKKHRVLLIALLCIAAGLLVYVADEALWDRFSAVQDKSDYNFEAQGGRLEIWKEGIWLFITHPILGVGIGQFTSALGMIGSGLYKTAHNSYIQIAAELGAPGLCAYLAMLWYAVRATLSGMRSKTLSKQERIRSTALLLSLAGFAVGSIFLSQAYSFILYYIIALTAVMSLNHQKQETAARLVTARQAESPVKRTAPASAHRAVHNELTNRLNVSASEALRRAQLTVAAAARRKDVEERLRQGDHLRKSGQSPSEHAKAEQDKKVNS